MTMFQLLLLIWDMRILIQNTANTHFYYCQYITQDESESLMHDKSIEIPMANRMMIFESGINLRLFLFSLYGVVQHDESLKYLKHLIAQRDRDSPREWGIATVSSVCRIIRTTYHQIRLHHNIMKCRMYVITYYCPASTYITIIITAYVNPILAFFKDIVVVFPVNDRQRHQRLKDTYNTNDIIMFPIYYNVICVEYIIVCRHCIVWVLFLTPCWQFGRSEPRY